MDSPFKLNIAPANYSGYVKALFKDQSDVNCSIKSKSQESVYLGCDATFMNLDRNMAREIGLALVRFSETGTLGGNGEGIVSEAQRVLAEWRSTAPAAKARIEKAESELAKLRDEFRMVAIELHIQKHYAVSGVRWEACEDCAKLRALLPEYAEESEETK